MADLPNKRWAKQQWRGWEGWGGGRWGLVGCKVSRHLCNHEAEVAGGGGGGRSSAEAVTGDRINSLRCAAATTELLFTHIMSVIRTCTSSKEAHPHTCRQHTHTCMHIQLSNGCWRKTHFLKAAITAKIDLIKTPTFSPSNGISSPPTSDPPAARSTGPPHHDSSMSQSLFPPTTAPQKVGKISLYWPNCLFLSGFFFFPFFFFWGGVQQR